MDDPYIRERDKILSRPVPIVTVIALALFNVTTLPLSPATSVYVVPVWSLSAASKPDMAPVFELAFVLVPRELKPH